jgi:hypothetical protein
MQNQKNRRINAVRAIHVHVLVLASLLKQIHIQPIEIRTSIQTRRVNSMIDAYLQNQSDCRRGTDRVDRRMCGGLEQAFVHLRAFGALVPLSVATGNAMTCDDDRAEARATVGLERSGQ